MHSRRFWQYVLRHRRAYVIGYAASAFSVAMAMSAPWVLRGAIDAIQRGQAGTRLALLAGALLLFALAENASSYLTRIQILGTAYRIESELRHDYFAHLQRMSLAFFQRVPTGDLMARAVNDIRAVQRLAGVGLMRSVQTTIMLVASIAFMFSLSPRLTLSMLSVLPVITLLFLFLGREIHRRFDQVQAQFSALSTRAQENFSGIRVVKAFAQEPAESARFRREVDLVGHTNLRLARVQGALWPAIGLVVGVASVILLWQGGGEVIGGRLTLGQLVQFSYYLARLSFPMIALGWITNLWQQGSASMIRLDEIFATPPDVRDDPDAGVLTAPRGAIEFRHVTVAFDGQPVLRDVSLTIPAGRTVAIVGPTGAGKSTLVGLVPRLYDPVEGQVLIDGQDVRHLTFASVRRAIALVPQETFLFSDTLRENIALGRDDHGDPGRRALTDGRDPVAAAADVAQLTVDIEGFPAGYETVVGERGVTLSGGQKQRTALARAVIRDPRILILDDALSSVDTDTERRILARLRDVMASRTCLVISHRISAIKHADWIVVLRDGRVAEEGAHETLVAQGGLYADLYERQLLQEELEAADPTPDHRDAAAALVPPDGPDA
ncbi:MAG TPA: ABC transporter ATP-binding protein [bacterium]|nr:ABC transporter ATP-binding protein [bacterium]